MAEKKPNRKPRRRSNNSGYLEKSPAICVVVHDQAGKPLPDSVATEILNSIYEVVQEHRLLINFTRT